ncbi:hypothetical protein DIURU_004588 [Diutina rugosa]|uniref:ERAD-associated E3 ubiquitin-protein ligase component HRD3 n=1 Tax=Diutina rugosa TaxID=5481 RepID=A0A642UGZ4_DIURU|nr:uncharacterized protein DIURU_004588 [Diutina rugosa]KAA8898744.1 hypothetical protein DIURU_004588 [Diutina rugosa]
MVALSTLVWAALAAASKLHEAVDTLSELPQVPGAPIVSNVFHSIAIPVWNSTSYHPGPVRDYERSKVARTVEIDVIPVLDTTNTPESWRMLGDIYMFGNYSITPNVTKAEQLYRRIANDESSTDTNRGHAYFMLGFIYGSDLFPEFPADKARSHLYYQQAVDLDNVDALLVMANQLKKSKKTCQQALMYYNKLAEYGMDWLEKNPRPVTVDGEVSYNIRIPDFNGGIYGDDISETSISVYSPRENHMIYRNQISEYNLELEDHAYFYYYYEAADYLSGDYLVAKNVTKAREVLQQCVNQGEDEYAPEYNIHSQTDRYYLGMCQAKLSALMMTDENPDMVKVNEYLNRAAKLAPKSRMVYNLLGQMLVKQGEYGDAVRAYKRAIDRGSIEAMTRLAELMSKTAPNGDPAKAKDAERLYQLMNWSAFNGSTKGLYHYLDYVQSGFAAQVDPALMVPRCQSLTYYYSVLVDRMSSFFYPSLRPAFEHYIRGNFQQALILYAIAAEQGSSPAQVSVAHLLYQRPTMAQRRWDNVPQYDCHRVSLALEYLKRASLADSDTMVLLGDIYHDGVPGCIEPDMSKAYHYYHKSSYHHRSQQGSFKLGRMYEYAEAPGCNGTADYYMANRLYEQSRDSMDLEDELDEAYNRPYHRRNRIPISWALLRLRFKLFFSIGDRRREPRSRAGWLDRIKRLGRRRHSQPASTNDNLDASAPTTASNIDHQSHPYDSGDYIVIFITLAFFFAVFIQNMIRQVRRARNPGINVDNVPVENIDENDENQNRDGWDFNGPGIRFRRQNFEFQFFAI